MPHEALVRRTERGLGIEALLARGADEVEEELAEELGVVHVHRQLDPRRDEPHASGTLLESLGREQRGEVLGHATEDALSVLRALRCLRALFALDALPLREQVAALDGDAFEHVRAAAYELLAQASSDVREVERPLLVSELRVDRDLEQEIAKLVAQPLEITGVERLERLVRLLEEMRPQRSMGLLAVPRAAVGRPQAIGDATDSGNGCEIYVRIDRRKDDESGVEHDERLEGERPFV